MLQPVGPLPPSVYWRRRAGAVAAVVLVLAVLIWAIVAASSDGGSDVPAAAPPAPAPSVAPPSAVASRGALPTPSNAAALLGSRVLPGTPSQTGTGPQSGPGALPGADSQPGGQQPGGQQPGGQQPGGQQPGGKPSRGAPQAGAPDVSPAPSSSAAPSSTPPPPIAAAPSIAPAPQAAAAPPRCADGDLRITARTDKPRYAAGERPLFSLVVTNTGSGPCTRDLDAARQAMAVVIKPGDGLWGSNDCSPGHSTDVRTLAPGQEAVFTVRWAGRRSSPGCSGDRGVVPAGDYQLLTRLDGTISDPAKFTLG